MKPASNIKKIKSTFLLIQPILQFMALMAVIFTVSRCSPLAPSTEKIRPGKIASTINNSQTTEDEKIKELIQAEDPINNSLKEIDSRNAELATTNEFDSKFTKSELLSDAIVPAASSPAPLAIIKSSELEKDLLKDQDGKARLNIVLDASLAQTVQGKINDRSLTASSYLLFSDSNTLANYNGIELKLKVAIAKSDDNRFVLEIRRDPLDARRNEISTSLLHHAIRDANSIAIILQ